MCTCRSAATSETLSSCKSSLTFVNFSSKVVHSLDLAVNLFCVINLVLTQKEGGRGGNQSQAQEGREEAEAAERLPVRMRAPRAGSAFAPGHDSKLKSRLLKAARNATAIKPRGSRRSRAEEARLATSDQEVADVEKAGWLDQARSGDRAQLRSRLPHQPSRPRSSALVGRPLARCRGSRGPEGRQTGERHYGPTRTARV